jgi:hypothetical protein
MRGVWVIGLHFYVGINVTILECVHPLSCPLSVHVSQWDDPGY